MAGTGMTKFDAVHCDECHEPRYPFAMHVNRPRTYTCQRCRAVAAGLPAWRPSKGAKDE